MFDPKGHCRARGVRSRWTAGAALLLGLAAAGCHEPSTPGAADPALTGVQADLVNFGMTTYLTREGVRSGEVRADSAYIYRDSTVAHMFGVEMTVFTGVGEERARVVADKGRLHQPTESMVAWGNVVVTLPEGRRRIETAELHYEPRSESIWSDSATVFVQEGRLTRGSCFRSDMSFNNWRICNPVGAASVAPDPAAAPAAPPVAPAPAAGSRP